MAEMPERMFGLEVGAPALLLLALLWRWVPVKAKFATSGPHFVYRSIEDLATDRNTGTRAIQEHLRQLRDAGLLSAAQQGQRRGYWLHTPTSLLDEGQPADDRVARKIDPPPPGDRRSFEQRSPIDHVRDRSSADDQTIGDRRSFEQRSPIVRAGVKEEPKEPEYPETAAGRQQAGRLAQVAQELLVEISAAVDQGTGVPLRSLPPDRRTLDLLVALLDVGDAGNLEARRAYVFELVVAFAAICRVNPAQAAWWSPEMFGQVVRKGTMSPWAAVEATVARQVRTDAIGSAAERAQAEKRASDEADRAAFETRRVTSDEQLAALAASAGAGSFGARLADDVLRRQGEARERDQAAAATAAQHKAAQQHQDQAAPLLAARAEWLTERLTEPQRLTAADIDELSQGELEQARSVVSRHLATARLEERDEQVSLLLQVRLLIDRRRKGINV